MSAERTSGPHSGARATPREGVTPAPGAPSVTALLRLLGVGAFAGVLLIAGLGTAAAVASLRRAESRANDVRVSRARGFLARQASVRRQHAREYAVWSELWDYIDRAGSPPAERWFAANIGDWIPQQYGDRAIGVWTRARRPVVRWSADGSSAAILDAFAQPETFARLDSVKIFGGLFRAGERLFLVGAGVVVRTEDPEARGPWHGYLLFARPVTDTVVAEWGAALQETVRLTPLGTALDATAEAVSSHLAAGGDSIETHVVVADVFARPVAVASLRGSRQLVRELHRSIYWSIAGALVLGLTLVGLLWLATERLVGRPVASIAAGLEGMRTAGRLAPLRSPGRAQEWHLIVARFNRTVESLRASEERFQSIWQSAAAGLFLVEESGGRIVDVNPSAERITGRGRTALEGTRIDDVLSGVSPDASPGSVFPCHRPDGSIVTLSVESAPLQLGPLGFVLWSVHDVTEREALAAQLRHSQKLELVGVLSSGLAHDFNNLLGAVALSAGELRHLIPEGHPGRAAVETIERSARRGGELNRQLLDFSRRERPPRRAVRVADLVADVDLLCGRLLDGTVQLEKRLDAPDAAVFADAGQLEQALLNLCLNARDAMPSGGILRLDVRTTDAAAAPDGVAPPLAPGRYVVLAVSDTGVGFGPDATAHLFEPFFTTKPRGKGTGLGLAIVFGVAKDHGGGVRAESTLGRGSRFEIYLPEAAAGAAAAGEEEDTSRPGGSETILIVDDDPDVRTALARALEALGYTVHVASSGWEGIERFRQYAKDIGLVVLDILMPEMGGTAVFEWIRGLWPEARVLAITGYGATADLQRLRDGGVNGVLLKPFETGELARAVRRILDSPGAGARASRSPAGAGPSRGPDALLHRDRDVRGVR